MAVPRHFNNFNITTNTPPNNTNINHNNIKLLRKCPPTPLKIILSQITTTGTHKVSLQEMEQFVNERKKYSKKFRKFVKLLKEDNVIIEMKKIERKRQEEEEEESEWNLNDGNNNNDIAMSKKKENNICLLKNKIKNDNNNNANNINSNSNNISSKNSTNSRSINTNNVKKKQKQ
jgi:hypothetical protein